MLSWRIIAGLVTGVAVLGAGPAVSASREPLIVTKLADPDPNFVPQKASADLETGAGGASDGPALDQAMQDFGRAIGQAVRIEQQATEARCRSGEPAGASEADRFAWAASCRYQRH